MAIVMRLVVLLVAVAPPATSLVVPLRPPASSLSIIDSQQHRPQAMCPIFGQLPLGWMLPLPVVQRCAPVHMQEAPFWENGALSAPPI